MKRDVTTPDDHAAAPPPAWAQNLLVAALAAYVLILGIGVIGVIFDIQAILDLFAFLTP